MNQGSCLSQLFKKFSDDNYSEEELLQLFDLIKDSENEPLVRSLISSELELKGENIYGKYPDYSAIGQVRASLIDQILKQETNPKEKRIPKISHSWLKIAALWLVIGTATTFLLFRHFTDTYDTQIRQHTKELITKNGQRKLIRLYDGTKIWLCPSSTLNYRDQLVNNFREVTLDGEAFFEVAKDQSHPFIIHSGQMRTEVVGTSFNIKSYSKQKIYKVTVVTGIVKVSILSNKKEKLSEVTLKPQQQASFDNSDVTLASKEVSTVEPVLKKKNGILSYDGTPVPDVVADFKRYYNVSIELENKSAACLCYGEFDTNKPVTTVLSQLAAAIGAKVKQTEKGYLIEGGCAER